MPAIQVARTDTFEQQRQKINQLGSTLFNITAGGSDLSTGNLKLGDGSLAIPSLAFVTDSSLGLYKSTTGTLGFVSNGKRILDISSLSTNFYKNVDVFKTSVVNTNTIITNPGQNYSNGTFTNIPLTGGTGSDATASITVVAYTGTTSVGTGYTPGTFSFVPLSGGSGTGAAIDFSVPSIQGNITAAGTGYTPAIYTDVPLTGGSGSGATATITVSGTQVSNVVINSSGTGYVSGNILSASATNLGGTGSGFQYTISNNPGTITSFTFVNRGSGYQIGDVLTLSGVINGVTAVLPGIVTGITTTLGTSTTLTVSSTSGITAGSVVTASGIGDVASGTTVVSIQNSTTLVISQIPIIPGDATLTFTPSSPNLINVSNSTGIRVNDIVTVTSGSGVLPAGTTVLSISGNTILLSQNPTTAGNATLRFSPPYGTGTGFSFTVVKLGSVESVSITNTGTGYSNNDLLSVNPVDLLSPINYFTYVIYVTRITFTNVVPTSAISVGQLLALSGVSAAPTASVIKVNSSGSNITSIVLESTSYISGDILTNVSLNSGSFTINTVSSPYYLYQITGSGITTTITTPNITLYTSNKYRFDFSDSSNSGHTFALSRFKDGKWGPSRIESLTSTMVVGSSTITVASTTGILPGMTVEQISGTGTLATTTVVTVPNSTTFTVETPPTASGTAILDIYGNEYIEGVVRTASYLEITISPTTPSTLYYYCQGHPDMGGEDGQEAVITVSQTNPNLLGSGFQLDIGNVSSTKNIFLDVASGEVGSSIITSTTGTVGTLTSTNITALNLISSPTVSTSAISSTNLTISASGSATFNAPTIQMGSYVSLTTSSGNLTTTGIVKTSQLNVNDYLKITNSNIETFGLNDIVFSPSTGRIAKVSSNSAFVLPSGSTFERPSTLAQSGAIRFNTDTNQYEGYSGTTSSWSSLGGVRDLDGNTYITAEFTIGSNDNTLWFYNDNNNTVKFTPEYQEFVSVKKVRSVNTSAPTYVNWAANTPVTVGQYLKYRNNIYEVVTAGVTGSSGNEPISTTGTDFANGTATLKFFITAVAPLTFEEISEVRIAPDGGTSLSINNDLRFATNVISTDTNDLLLRPNSGKKVTVDAKTSLVLPVGTTNERGAPVRGSVRFNTTILQYEGYDGANWSSLGGVRDVDGNTYIIPELTPGGNQNILYFYNNGSNTLRVTENEIQLDTIDTITSPTSNSLNLEASLVTFNNLAASIDTSSATTTFISTTKDNLDLGLSSGIVNDPLLRLSDTGDIFYNLGFGTGVYNGIKIFDKGLKELELADYKIFTEDVTLTKNTIDAGSSIAYDPSIHRSAKVQIVAHNETTGDKEFLEYSVIDKGSDIFHTDFGNVKTGAELISSVFDFDVNNRVRVTFTLDSSISAGNVVKVTVISNIIKR